MNTLDEPRISHPSAPPNLPGAEVADRPVTIYEVHPDSWMRTSDNRPLPAGELGSKLGDYAANLNFSHVQILADPDACFAGPEQVHNLVHCLHARGLGVILESLTPEGEPAGQGSGGIRNFHGVPELVDKLDVDGVREGDTTFMEVQRLPLALRTDSAWSAAMLHYLGQDPFFRKFHHGELFAGDLDGNHSILALSHGDVRPGQKSLLGRMAGDEWQKFANLRLLLANQWARPGRKLLFMGGEFAQWNDWNPSHGLDWHLVREGSRHHGVQRMVSRLNQLYQQEPALQHDAPAGMSWGDRSDAAESTVNWFRLGPQGELILAAFNFTPVPRHNHRVGVPRGGAWLELFNSDAYEYGGSGQGNLGGVEASPLGWQQHSHSLNITLPPLGAVYLKAAERS